MAAQQGYEEVAKLLLKYRAQVGKPHKNGKTALHLAATRGDAEIVRLLLEARADKDAVRPCDEATALHLAAQNGHLEVVQLLMQAGAALDMFTKFGETALQLAIVNGHSSVVQLLLEAGAAPGRMAFQVGFRDIAGDSTSDGVRWHRSACGCMIA